MSAVEWLILTVMGVLTGVLLNLYHGVDKNRKFTGQRGVLGGSRALWLSPLVVITQ